MEIDRNRLQIGGTIPAVLVERINIACKERNWSKSRILQDAIEMYMNHLEANEQDKA